MRTHLSQRRIHEALQVVKAQAEAMTLEQLKRFSAVGESILSEGKEEGQNPEATP